MKLYHSFWEHGWNNMTQELYELHKLSVIAALESYGNITLITTEVGKKFLGDLPYTNIEFFEEEIPIEYKDTWGISKMFAYKQLCRKNEPFMHVDYDVFLFKKLPDWLEKSEVFYQSIENGNQVDSFYGLEYFFSDCKNLYLSDVKINQAFNMGIFGGNNIEAIDYYLDESFKLLFDEDNKSYWLTPNPNIMHCSKAVILEQWYIISCFENINIKATSLFKDWPTEEEAIEYGYCHVWGAKNDKNIIAKIKNKIIKYENF